MNPEISEWFYEYAKLIAERFSDRVTHYFTLNEPQCIAGEGYLAGITAPGMKVGKKEYFQIWHNLLKAHGRGVQALRKYSKNPIQVGVACCGAAYYPASNLPQDIEAARKVNFEVGQEEINDWNWCISFFCDPVYKGKYPEKVLEKYKEFMPEITKEDMQLISQQLDFCAQNIYNAVEVRMGKNGKAERVKRDPGFPKTALQWPVTPKALYWTVKFLYERYHLPVYISENGMSSTDWINMDGNVHDSIRIDFLHRYLSELKKAVDEGIDVSGYFEWSLLDNFEWTNGYNQRFGLVYVDFQTQKRVLKDSAYWYHDVIRTNGENL